jgi:predicted acetyltransferase
MNKNVTIQRAELKDKVILENLFQLYLHDLSEFATTLEISVHGRFENDDVSLYFEKEHLIPITIKYMDKTIGFAMFNFCKNEGVDYVINDMFIIKKHRGKGIGKLVANEIFDHYKGRYWIIELDANKPAISFWHSIFKEKGIEYEEVHKDFDGEDCVIQKFVVE